MLSTNFKSNPSKKQNGQIGIIIILLMTILLTLGISLGLRTSKKQEVSIEQEESTRVFNSAESGVERALSKIYRQEKQGNPVGDEIVAGDDNEEYQIETKSELEMYIDQGISVKAPLDNTTDVDIDWWLERGTDCANDQPSAVIVSIYNNSGGNITSRYLGFDPCHSDRNNNFDNPSSSPRAGYNYRATISLQAGDAYLRVTPLYNSSKVYLSGGAISQGQYDISSRATDSDATVAKAIDVSRSLPAAPSFMDYALISGANLSK
jgi:hypothetical protein